MTLGHFPAAPALAGSTAASEAGPDPTLAALVFVTLVLATVLSVYLALRLYRGYRSGEQAGMLVLGVGLVLLTTVPIVLRLVLANVPGVGVEVRELLATVSQLLGLLVILGVIYDPE